MAQTKQQKQQTALNKLLQAMQAEKESRQSLQAQSYHLIEPSQNELRLSIEISNLKVTMGLQQANPLPDFWQ